ncbi:MAG: 5'/3'-nucleotidase SurE [Alphaproteobacteria bacterium]|nr:5'/3'-nucleotidase SurE [Alphaproteobacteria bacterium]
MAVYPLPDVAADLSAHRILVTNDDGFTSEGIELLERAARRLSDDVWLVAPEYEQSGTGHSLTLTQPLRFRALDERHFAVRGTPTDCVLLAVNQIIEGRRPTLVLSGVNRGANMGEDITYSGTVAAAMEGTLLGIPSIALSQSIYPGATSIDWGAASECLESVVRWIVSVGWGREVLMNVNFPDARRGAVTGMEITLQGQRDPADILFDERVDTRGQTYFWIGYRRSREELHDDTDIKAVREGRVSVTPLHLDLTHIEARRLLQEAAEGLGGV